MRIRYLPHHPNLASARLRGIIPAQQLRHLGFETCIKGPADWAVLSKHGWGEEATRDADRVCFDICDDHFSGEFAEHYRTWAARADLLTCNSVAMSEIILSKVGKVAHVIPDPWETPERDPKCHAPLLWFGQALNLIDLMPIIERLPELLIVSDHEHPRIVRWTPEAMEQAWNTCGLVVLPTGQKKGKSANRAIESIRRGVFPVCGHLPAYAELGLGVDDIPAEVDRVLTHKGHTLERIMDLQDAVRDRFSPATIGRMWAQCFV